MASLGGTTLTTWVGLDEIVCVESNQDEERGFSAGSGVYIGKHGYPKVENVRCAPWWGMEPNRRPGICRENGEMNGRE